MITKTAFTVGKGWLHLILGISITCFLMQYGLTEYAQSNSRFWTDPFVDLVNFFQGIELRSFILPVLVYFGIDWGIGFFIEGGELVFFKASWDWNDVNWTGLGAPVAMVLFLIFGRSVIIYYLSLVIILVNIGYVVYLFLPSIRKTKIRINHPWN